MSKLVENSSFWSRRLLRTFSGGLTKNCCFIHIPKCAGSSLSRALTSVCGLRQRSYRIEAMASRRSAALLYGIDPQQMFSDTAEADRTYRVLFDHREVILLYALASSETVVSGHFFYSDRAFQAFGERYGFITVLREPVSRVISHYGYLKATGELDLSFDDYLATSLARRHGSEMTRYLCGTPDREEAELRAALETAKANLRNFAVVGFTEDMAAFVKNFEAAFGATLAIPWRNTAAGRKPQFTETQMAAVKSLCALDQELYDWAKTEFGRD